MNASNKEMKHSPCLEKVAEMQRRDGVVINTMSKENSPDEVLSCSENQKDFDEESNFTDNQEKLGKYHQIHNENKNDERFCCIDIDGGDQQSEFSHIANNIPGQGKKEESHTSILIDHQGCKKTILEEIDALAAESLKETNERLSNSSVVFETEVQERSASVACVLSKNEKAKDKENNRLEIFATSPRQNDGCLKVDNIVAHQKHHQKGVSCTEKVEDVKMDCKLSASIPFKEDPFSLSSDEDFSPKVYRPIQRSISMCQHRPKVDLKRPASPLNGGNTSFEQLPSTSSTKGQLERSELTDCFLERKKLKHSRQVVYIHNEEMVEKTNRLWRIKGRANLVHSLISVYGILQYIDISEPRYATESEILGFHCQDYLNFLKGISDDDEDNSDSVMDEAENYGLSYDCPLQKDCFHIASLISGGTITAAEALCDDRANIAINWCGGWHHAKRDSASGFCYLNDIVLGILKLRERFDKVLYIDIDLHHGDGVEEAFYMTPKVMTVSFHKCAPGFFPGSGNVEDIGTGRGKYYAVNVPLMDGIKDNEFYFIFSSILKSVKERFNPEAVVMQCGADTLAEDPMLSFNLTHLALAKCVCFVLTWNLPTLLLGGGGYHFANTARCWTFITAMAAGKKLPIDIPEHEDFPEYGPSYELTTLQGYRKDCNSKEHLRQLLVQVHRNLSKI